MRRQNIKKCCVPASPGPTRDGRHGARTSVQMLLVREHPAGLVSNATISPESTRARRRLMPFRDASGPAGCTHAAGIAPTRLSFGGVESAPAFTAGPRHPDDPPYAERSKLEAFAAGRDSSGVSLDTMAAPLEFEAGSSPVYLRRRANTGCRHSRRREAPSFSRSWPVTPPSLCNSSRFTQAAPFAEPDSTRATNYSVTYITEHLAKSRPKTGRMKPFCRNRETFLKHTGRISPANTGRQRRPGGIT